MALHTCSGSALTLIHWRLCAFMLAQLQHALKILQHALNNPRRMLQVSERNLQTAMHIHILVEDAYAEICYLQIIGLV